MTTAIIVVFLLIEVAIPIVLVLRFNHVEQRKTEGMVAAFRQRWDECPACQPFGGYWLGETRPDGSVETITCDLCHGTGRRPDAEPAMSPSGHTDPGATAPDGR